MQQENDTIYNSKSSNALSPESIGCVLAKDR